MVQRIKEKKKEKRENYLDNYLKELSYMKSYRYSEIKLALEKLCIKNPEVLKYITYPRLNSLENLKETQKHNLIFSSDRLKEFNFTIALLSFYKDKIKRFIELKSEYLHNFLCGNYEKALKILNNIEEELGYSLWVIENKINLIELYQGKKAQKEYVRLIVENNKIGFIVRFIVYNCSYKAQLKTEKEYYLFFKEYLKESDVISSYVKYKIDYYNQFKNLSNKEFILRTETKISIFDGYETLVKLLQLLLLEENEKANELVTLFANEFRNINDYRVRKMEEKINDRLLFEDKMILECFDLYERGLYDKCKNKCEILLEKSMTISEIYDIYINSCIRIGEDFFLKPESVFYNILNLIRDLKMLKNNPKDILQEINNYLRIYSSNNWSTAIYYMKEFILNSYKIQKKDVFLYQLNNVFYDIKNIEGYNGTNNIYIQIFQQNKNLTVMQLLNNFYENKFERIEKMIIPEERKIRYIVEGYFKLKNYKKVLSLKNEINELDILSFSSIVRCYILSYFYVGKVKKAVQVLVEKYLENKNLSIYLPLKEIVYSRTILELAEEIELPIIFNIYFKEIEDYELDSFKEFETYEDFLRFCEIEKPLELIKIDEKIKIDSKKMNYFLENVCSIENMERSIYFDSEVEIIDERMGICQYLVKKNNSSKLVDEILNLNKQKIFEQGIAQLNDGKINLNIDEIKKITIEELGDKFKIYKTTQELGLNIVEDFFEPLKLFQIQDSEIKTLETTNLLHMIIREIRDILILNEKFGLDTCLSTQIRHGIIVNALRSVFEDLKLITRKGKSGEYLENEYWLSNYGLVLESGDSNAEKLSRILKGTSKKIDELALSIKNELIQINTEKKNNEKGLFNYYLYIEEVKEWEKEIKKMSSINEVVDFVISRLLERTAINLINVQKNLLLKIQPQFVEILNWSLKEVSTLQGLNVSELKSKVISGRQSIQNEINKISMWFNLSAKNRIGNYDSDILKKLLNHSIRCNLKVDDEEMLMFKGETLNSIFHILFNLCHNAVSHSGREDILCNLKITKDEDNVILCLKNKLHIDLEKAQNEISNIRLKLNSPNQKKISNEGGTGFYKIKNILDNTLKIKNDINIYISDKEEFIVDIILDKGVLIDENINY
ncbi:hypothetical protein [Cetobacterium sp. 2G large]|uniref:hypothetical protein n=1 Tax=Cetobacterium sp. 2G large TaxID=2759680 RepID=UPI00163C38AF|nr:hypothetical protein [Cetobacterium sp. 2G large]MBC2853535.1 hypothetical protein [Cetobacterium sp. 2G large]